VELYTLKTFTPKERSEVDIRIAQEIKNHQDWMYEIGQSIRILKEGLAGLSVIHERNLSKLDSEHKSILDCISRILQEKVLEEIR
jgi:hypothetical protein